MTYFGPNLLSNDITTSEYDDSKIENDFRTIFHGLSWKNTTATMSFIAFKFDQNSYLYISKKFGWCTLDCFFSGNITKSNDELFYSAIGIYNL